MYTRFYRWASDRLGDEGIVAFVTNRSFIDAKTYDGFRKVVADEFSHIYVLDLGGDVRKNPRLSGPKHNVFAIQTGIAIAFMVRRKDHEDNPYRIYYARRPEMEEAKDKLRFLATKRFEQIEFEQIRPSKKHYWINLAENDWDELLALASKRQQDSEVVFNLASPGIKTNRDEWVYSFSKASLINAVSWFIQVFNEEVDRFQDQHPSNIDELLNYSIKWSSSLRSFFERREKLQPDRNLVATVLYRPFVKMYYYAEKQLSDRLTSNHYEMFGQQLAKANKVIIVVEGKRLDFTLLASDIPSGYAMFSLDPEQCLPLYRYDKRGNRIDNVTDWALTQFQEQYATTADTTPPISKLDIFHYVYAVLHDPAYRKKYRLNLKREFPRIPFYDDFWQWAEWGWQLMELHLNYESVDPYPLQRHEVDPESVRKAYKARLIADKKKGLIELDTLTTLSGVPPEAWEYRLGNRSALEWILDRYKERKPRDPTIREKFNAYRFIDYKEQVIDLLTRVTTVSVETMKIINQMETVATD